MNSFVDDSLFFSPLTGWVDESTVSPHGFGGPLSAKNSLFKPGQFGEAGRAGGHRRALYRLGKSGCKSACLRVAKKNTVPYNYRHGAVLFVLSVNEIPLRAGGLMCRPWRERWRGSRSCSWEERKWEGFHTVLEKPARSANAKPLSQQHTLTTRSYLVFTGSLQRLELLPRRLTQAHLVLLPGQKGYTEGKQHKSGLFLKKKKRKKESRREQRWWMLCLVVKSVMISLFCVAELSVWPAAEPDWSRVLTCTRVHQETQLLSAPVRLW